MSYPRSVALVLALGLFSIGFAGCDATSPSQALKFNEAITGANQQLMEAGLGFGTKVPMAMSGDPSSAANLKTAHDQVMQTLENVEAEMKALKVPDSPSAKGLYDAHQTFLVGQRRMLTNDFASIVTIAADKTTSSAEKNQKVQDVLDRIGKAEAADLKVLQAAQKTFAAAHNMRLQ